MHAPDITLADKPCPDCKGRGRERMLYAQGLVERFIDGHLCHTCEGTGKLILYHTHYSATPPANTTTPDRRHCIAPGYDAALTEALRPSRATSRDKAASAAIRKDALEMPHATHPHP